MKQFTIRTISLILALVLVTGMIPTAHAYTLSGWAAEEVGEMEDMGLIPDSLMSADLTKNITRLDMCRIAVLAYEHLTGNEIPQPHIHPFPDTQDPSVEKANWAGLVDGRADGKFYPDDTLNRVEFFAFVGKFLNAVGYPITESDYADLSGFSDADTLPKWATDFARLTVGIGVVKGTSTATPTLSWSDVTSAQQAICMFYRACNAAGLQELDPPELKPVYDAFENLSSWAEESVMAMDDMGLIPDSVKYSSMKGYITRADMCTIVMNTYKNLWGITDADMGPVDYNPFTDTDSLDVINCYRLEIVSGDGNGLFRPDDPITRQEYFKIAQNFLEAIGYLHEDELMIDLTGIDPETNEKYYGDGDQVSGYAQAPTRVLLALGLVNGSMQKTTNAAGKEIELCFLNPKNDIICQEAIAIFHRAHHFAMTWKPTEEEPPTDPIEPSEPDDPTEPSEPDDPTEPTEPQDPETLTVIERVIKLAMEIEADDRYGYVWGGKKPSDGGFDCSGFVYYVYNTEAGTNFYPPCSSICRAIPDEYIVPRDELMPGDIIFFWNTSKTDYQHVGLYIGNGKMVHASNSRVGIIVSGIDEPYYLGRYMHAKRVPSSMLKP